MTIYEIWGHLKLELTVQTGQLNCTADAFEMIFFIWKLQKAISDTVSGKRRRQLNPKAVVSSPYCVMLQQQRLLSSLPTIKIAVVAPQTNYVPGRHGSSVQTGWGRGPRASNGSLVEVGTHSNNVHRQTTMGEAMGASNQGFSKALTPGIHLSLLAITPG